MTMISLKLDKEGDLVFDEHHNIEMVEGLEEVKQRLRLTLGTNHGEWFLNLRFGVPWINMLSEGEPAERFRKEILKVLNSDPAIDEVESIDINLDRQNRKLEIEFVVIADEERFRERVVI